MSPRAGQGRRHHGGLVAGGCLSGIYETEGGGRILEEDLEAGEV